MAKWTRPVHSALFIVQTGDRVQLLAHIYISACRRARYQTADYLLTLLTYLLTYLSAQAESSVTMSEKQFDELVEICLPAKLFRRSVGIAFDVGMYLNGNKCPK